MRNLKKLLAVVVALCVLFTFTIPAFADTATEKTAAQIAEDLGVLKGDGDGVTDAYLAKGTTRIQAAILYLRLLGLEDEAKAETSTDNFEDAANMAWAEGKAILAYLKNNPELGWQGDTINFGAQNPATAQMLYKAILTALGYVQGVDFEYADAITFAGEKGLTAIASVTELTNDDVAAALVEALSANIKDGSKTLVADLVAKGVITEAAAEAAGLLATAVALDVSSAVALNSKVIEVSLGTAAVAKDLTGVTVKDSAAKDIAVSKIEFAPWATNGKTVLVTLAADTTVGSLYTLTAGEKSINFGGKSADTSKPTVVDNGVISADYNQVKVTFSEPVLLNGTTFVIAEKYGTMTALEVKSIAYDSSTVILLTTADQKDATLYGIEVAGAVDLAGNTMDKDTAKTFTGTKKNDSDLKVAAAYGLNNPEEVTVQFNVRVDAATAVAANFKVEEMYGTKEVLPVTAVKVGAKDDTTGVNGATLVNDVSSVNDAQKNVVLTVPGLKDSTLYKVTVSGMSSAYGKALSTTSSDQTASFSALKKPADPFTYSITGGVATSNTTIEVQFAQKVVKADAENIANYAIAEAYGTKAALAVTKAELQSGDKKVKLTVAAMQTVLYKMTITNINDIYGNAIKTADSANVVSFSGVAVASKISKIDSIVYDGASKTVIIVDFDVAVGNSATDVSHYTIDKSVGYPEKAEKGTNADQVKLTIPKLTNDETYKLTVKGLENADGVAMGSDGVSLTFVGRGDDSTNPELVAVMPIDNQTLRIYFDRDVTNSMINGATKIWDKDNKVIRAGALGYKNVGGTTDLAGEYAYQDPETASALIVRVDTNDAFKATNKDTNLNAFQLDGTDALFASGKDKLLFAPKDDEPLNIKIDGVMALNNRTIRVYFNQPVYGTLDAFAKVDLTKATFAAATISLSNATAIDSTKKIYDFKTSADLTNASYWLTVNDSLDLGNIVIKDVNLAAPAVGIVTLNDDDAGTTGVQQFKQFAGSATAKGDIKDVQVYMTDEKTIKVYYPELMTAADVKNKANYDLVGSDGITAVLMGTTPGAAFNAANDIGEISYSSTDNTALITLNKKVFSAPTGLYLKFGTGINNAVQTAQVKDGIANIIKQFALSAADSAKVTLSSASFDNNANKLTIVFNQKIKTDTNIAAATVTTTPTALQAMLSLTIPGLDLTTSYTVFNTIEALDADGNAVADTSLAYVTKKIVIYFDDGATASVVGKVKIASATGYTGINGNGGNTDSEVPFAQ